MMRVVVALALLTLAACAEAPPAPGDVITMKASEPAPAAFPAPGTVWRLDQSDLKTLSPAPVAEPPPPPRWPPPPRPNDPPPRAYYYPQPYYYYPPAYGSFWYWRRW